MDKDPGVPKSYAPLLWPDIQFSETDWSASIMGAFQSLIKRPYTICFISDEFNDGMNLFFGDIKKLGRHDTCVFVQLREEIPQNFNKASLIELGFHEVISRNPSGKEMALLHKALNLEYRRREVIRRVTDVQEALSVLLRHIDQVSLDRKRGRSACLDKAIADFIFLHASFDSDVLMQYFSCLAEQSEKAQGFEQMQIVLPKIVKSDNYPGIIDGRYVGISRRVWQLLVEKYGVSETDIDKIPDVIKKLEDEGKLDLSALEEESELKAPDL